MNRFELKLAGKIALACAVHGYEPKAIMVHISDAGEVKFATATDSDTDANNPFTSAWLTESWFELYLHDSKEIAQEWAEVVSESDSELLMALGAYFGIRALENRLNLHDRIGQLDIPYHEDGQYEGEDFNQFWDWIVDGEYPVIERPEQYIWWLNWVNEPAHQPTDEQKQRWYDYVIEYNGKIEQLNALKEELADEGEITYEQSGIFTTVRYTEEANNRIGILRESLGLSQWDTNPLRVPSVE